VVIEILPETLKDIDPTLAAMPTEKAIDRLIREQGLKAQLQMQSFVTGQLFVKLDYFPDTPIQLTGVGSALPEMPVAPTRSEELERTIRRGLGELAQVPFAEILKKTESALSGIDSLVHSPELRQTLVTLNNVLESTDELMNRLHAQVDPVASSVVHTSDQFAAAAGNLSRASDRFARAAETADTTLAGADQVLTQLGDMAAEDLLQLHAALRELSAAARSIRILADYLERNPSAVILGKD
jgi:paraquat-inducible protein B